MHAHPRTREPLLPPPNPDFIPPRPPSVRPWTGLRRVLAFRLDSAGDVLMTTPALRALRASGVEHLALATSSAGAPAAALLPELDEVIVHDAPWVGGGVDGNDPRSDRTWIEEIAARRFDAAAIFTVCTQSALPAAFVAYMAGIPRRLAHARENPYHLLTDWVPEPEIDGPRRHEVRRQLDLLSAVGISGADEHLSLHVPDWASRGIRGRLVELGIDAGTPWLVVHPGAAAPSRRYPPEQYILALQEIRARTGWPIVLTGSTAELPLASSIAGALGSGVVSLAGELSFAELAALIAVAPMLLTNNTGPVHVAAAVGTPVVDLYALTNRQHTPWQVPSRVLSVEVPCAGCGRSVCPLVHNRCLHGVEPSAVADAVLDLAAEVGMPIALPNAMRPPRARQPRQRGPRENAPIAS